MNEIIVKSSLDGSDEPCLFQPAKMTGLRPLVVGLHTWSFDRKNPGTVNGLMPVAERNEWHVLFPEFRGSNLSSNPRCRQACGSKLAKQDVVDAVEFVAAHYPVDKKNIFLAGGSGGGHMALLMAAYRPDLWKRVLAFCPITDLAGWHGQNPGYTAHMEACCGGSPDQTPQEYAMRSPLTYAAEIAKSRTNIYHGKSDNSVPFTHSMILFDRINQINAESKVFLEIFEGGHEILFDVIESRIAAALTENSDADGKKLSG